MDEQAFREFVQANQDRVYSYAWYFLRHREDAQDVTQEAFVRLWRQGPAADDAGPTRLADAGGAQPLRRCRPATAGPARPGPGRAAEGELERHPGPPIRTVALEAAQDQQRRHDAVAEALGGLSARRARG